MAVTFFSKQLSETLQSQSLELVTMVIVINVVIGGINEEDLKWLAYVRNCPISYTVRLQLCRLIRAKYIEDLTW